MLANALLHLILTKIYSCHALGCGNRVVLGTPLAIGLVVYILQWQYLIRIREYFHPRKGFLGQMHTSGFSEFHCI